MNFIHQLRNSTPDERVTLIRSRYEKNFAFFKKEYPDVTSFIERTPSRYHLNLTESFFELVDTKTEKLCNADMGLDREAELAGQYNHPDWLDLHNIRLQSEPEFPLHHIPVDYLRTELAKTFNDIHERIVLGSVPLQNEITGKRFSPPCVFLGIFHGLHIDYYLNEHQVPSLLLIEPEAEKFETSLFFLDYSWIKDRCGSLYLVIGDDCSSLGIRNFFSIHKIHIRMWCRLFQSSPVETSNHFIEAIRRYQRGWTDIFFPLDIEFSSLRNGMANIGNGLPLLSGFPTLSKNSVIAIVASGPSLDNHIEWLVENRDRIILFAVHSVVRVLRQHGIRPDFQFNLDSDRDKDLVDSLKLFRDVPMISDYRTGANFLSAVDKTMLCAEKIKPTVVDFVFTLEETHPSTTNLAFSFACSCRPNAILLLGCDFGYKSSDQTHAMNTMHSQSSTDVMAHLQASENESYTIANFPEDKTVLTNSFLTYARLAVENCALQHNREIKIMNFSRGAKINGVEACHAAQFVFPKSVIERSSDIQRIIDCFAPAREGYNYRKYQISAESMSIRMKKKLLQAMELDEFSRTAFSQRIDAAIDLALEQCRSSKNDYRMTIFSKLFTDLLSIWNCYMIVSNDIRESEVVYEKGIEILREAFAKIESLEVLEHLLENQGYENNLNRNNN